MILTQGFAVDLRSGMPWRKPTVLYLWPVTDVFDIEARWLKCNHVCAFEIIQLFCVMFCVFRLVYKFDFRVVINETANKWRPAERRLCNDIHFFWQDLYDFPWPSYGVLSYSPHCSGQLLFCWVTDSDIPMRGCRRLSTSREGGGGGAVYRAPAPKFADVSHSRHIWLNSCIVHLSSPKFQL
jgi:hypothetical protein